MHFGYIGQAGTGKTTELIKKLEAQLAGVTWSDHNSVLALTFMHGSRKRLTQKLGQLARKYRIECQTIDSFSTHLVCRYRRHLGINTTISILSDDNQTPMINYRADDVLVNLSFIRSSARALLKNKSVRDCIRNAYTCIVVDEFQDCEADLLEFIKSLSEINTMLLAADDFQNLNTKDTTCEATNWLKANAEIFQLEHIHRTDNSRILNSAYGLRTNTKVQDGISIEVSTSHNLAAYKILAMIHWKSWGLRGSSIAIISPVNVSVSKFVANTLERVKKPFPKHPSLSPVFIKEENRTEELIENVLIILPNYENLGEVSLKDLNSWSTLNHPIVKSSIKEAKRLFQVKGLIYLEKHRFNEIVEKQLHLYRAYRHSLKNENFIFTTIHGAKNREFDFVIVLWPYEGQSQPLPKRKLLYNAITRAKKDVLIIAQSNNAAGTQIKTDKVFSLFF